MGIFCISKLLMGVARDANYSDSPSLREIMRGEDFEARTNRLYVGFEVF